MPRRGRSRRRADTALVQTTPHCPRVGCNSDHADFAEYAEFTQFSLCSWRGGEAALFPVLVIYVVKLINEERG